MDFVREKDKHSELFTQTMGIMYPVIILFGFYVIHNGVDTTGGGFQGGAVLSCVFIVHYLATNDLIITLSFLIRLEKILYVFIALTGLIFVIYSGGAFSFEVKRLYMLLMDALIALEVACGLTVVFYRFIYFETR